MKRLKVIIISLTTALILTAGGLTFWAYRELRAPQIHAHENDYLEIPRGSAPDQIAARLEGAGVVRRGWLLRLYIRLSGAGPRLKAGEYRFPSPISPVEVVKRLEEGEQRLSRFTVPEGRDRWDIAEQLARLPELNLANKEAALTLMDDVSLIGDLDPTARNLEGYLFPDTYSFPPNTTAREMVASMARRFRQVWQERFAERARAANLSPREVVTVASLIETEAKLKEERPVIASVIFNRLRLNIPLGIDSTVIYASKLAGKWRDDGKVYRSDIDRDSPYNTRRQAGLPPGPVASPGVSSIEAALSPAATDYLYYVREPKRNDGAHNFYSSDADFQRGVQALRDWERARDAGQLDSGEGQNAQPTPQSP
jgi:UPF0755 protein